MKLNKILLLLLILSICVTCLVACGTPTFTVQFDLAGGTLEDVDLTNGLTVEEGTTLDLSQYQPTKANHTFNGWKSGETSYSATDTVVVTADLQLTAQWIDDIAVALDEAKTTAKAALESYKDASNYRDAQQAELATAVTNGKTAIDNATDLAGVEAALANAKTAIDAIKTDAELTVEEAAQALANAKTTAKAALESYKDASNYRDAQKTELATAVANGKTAIDNVTDLAGVEAALANAKTTIDAIETDAQITAKEPTITTTLSNGAVFTNTKATIDVWAKTATGTKLNKANVSVTVNGVAMSVNWDDNEKTSYNFVFVEGENTVVITAIDGAYTKIVSYTVTCDLTTPTKVTVAVEGFSIGIGYIIEPYTVVLDEQTLSEMASMYNYASAKEMKNNLTAAYVLDYVLQSNGLEMDYQGKLYSGGGFYMESMSGIDTSNIAIPEELIAKLLENGYFIEDAIYEEGTLGEFDLTFGSGWMYAINNVFPNVGFCDYIPQDGDVMRIQFTLAYGADIGTTMVGDLWFETVNRDNLTVLISKALEAGVDITDALEVISTFGVTQSNLDTAYQALEVAIKAMPEILANAKTTAKAALESYKDASNYRDAQKTELATAVTNGKTAIDNATDLAGVEAALANAKTAVDAIKTDAELTAEETAQALANAKTTAKAELESYKDANNYRDAQKTELATAVANGKTAIDNATDLAGVEAALANAKATVDAIKTDAELTEEETAQALANAKTTAKATLESYKDASNYRDAQKTELATAVTNGKTAIDNATDLAGVEAALANAKTVIDEIKTDAEFTAEEAAQALANAKTTAKATLETYVDANNYRPAQQAELATAIANGKTAIDNATDLAGVETALETAKAVIDTIKTDAQLKAEEETTAKPTIWTDVADGNVYSTTNVNINVIAKDANGVKLSKDYVTVTVNGVEAALLWDDLNLTSFKLVLTEGSNVIAITATDGGQSVTETFTVTCNLEAAASIVISIEAFSIGMGYVVQPYKITLDTATLTAMANYFALPNAEAMKAQLNGAFLLEYVIHLHGYTSMYTGAIESGYYLASISGVDTSKATISEEMEEKLNENWMWVDSYEVLEEGTLSQMDFCQYSGWMYGANGVALNVGFDQYIPQNGDVVRVQFTLAWGMDVGLQGGLGMGDMPTFYPELNKDRLTALIAEALIKGVDVTQEMELAATLDTDQETIDAAVVALQTKLQQ